MQGRGFTVRYFGRHPQNKSFRGAHQNQFSDRLRNRKSPNDNVPNKTYFNRKHLGQSDENHLQRTTGRSKENKLKLALPNNGPTLNIHCPLSKTPDHSVNLSCCDPFLYITRRTTDSEPKRQNTRTLRSMD